MPGSIYDWSTITGNNDQADADIDWREGQFPDTVNDSGRAMMGRVAEFRNDVSGTITAGGTANTLLLTANSAFKSLANGRKITFRAAANNTSAASINVNGLGSKKIRAMGTAGDVDLAANDLKANGVYTIVYSASADGGTGAWILFAPFSKTIDGNKIDALPAGTRMLFQQTAAPTGWTKETTHDNKALRIVSGSVTTGGSVTFTTAFSSARATTSVTQGGTVGGTAINTAQLPSHTHGAGTLAGTAVSAGAHTHGPGTLAGVTNTTGNHTHGTTAGANYLVFTGAGGNSDASAGTTIFGGSMVAAGNHAHTVDVNAGATASGGVHTHTVDVTTGTTAAQGSGEAHAHTFTGEEHSHTTDLAVQYVDVIICEKAA